MKNHVFPVITINRYSLFIFTHLSNNLFTEQQFTEQQFTILHLSHDEKKDLKKDLLLCGLSNNISKHTFDILNHNHKAKNI